MIFFFFNVSSLIFKENHVVIEEDNPSEKNYYGRRITKWYILDGGELTRNINQKKKSDVLQACRCPLCEKCYMREYIFNKHLEYWESYREVWLFLWVNNLKERQLFSNQMNRNRLDLILARRYYNCFTIENLRCLNSAANEII